MGMLLLLLLISPIYIIQKTLDLHKPYSFLLVFYFSIIISLLSRFLEQYHLNSVKMLLLSWWRPYHVLPRLTPVAYTLMIEECLGFNLSHHTTLPTRYLPGN